MCNDYPDVMARGGWDAWTGHSEPLWFSQDETLPTPQAFERPRPTYPEYVWPEQDMTPARREEKYDREESYDREEDFYRNVPQSGAVDITGNGEGTERVRAGFEGAWGGIESHGLPGAGHEGGGLGPMGAATAASSVAIRPTGDRWFSEDGSFPAQFYEGTFAGTAPNNPEGTSDYIGMHRDGISMADDEDSEDWVPDASDGADGDDDAGGDDDQWARRPAPSGGVLQRGAKLRARQQSLAQEVVGSDVTDIGEANRPESVPGEISPLPGATRHRPAPRLRCARVQVAGRGARRGRRG